MRAKLALTYGSKCPVHVPDNTELRAKLQLAMPSLKTLETWLKAIHKNGKDAGPHIASVRAYAEEYWAAVQDGYGQNFANIDFNTPDADMLDHLATNVYSFSYAKNLAELNALSSAMIGADGKLLSYVDFKQEAVKIVGEFRGAWLEAEYELAVAGGQMASKWLEFEKTGEQTLLRYSTVKDARVSDICRPLEGIQKPIHDAFWNTHYPPNHFRCRCDVDRLVSGTTTPDSKVPAVDIPPMLRTNLAKDKLVFPINHPYYQGVSKTDAAKARTLYGKF